MATSCEEPTHWKRSWCWERLKAGRKGDNRGWDDWMASPTQWTWVWANSRRQWRTGKPGVLHPWGCRVRQNWSDLACTHALLGWVGFGKKTLSWFYITQSKAGVPGSLRRCPCLGSPGRWESFCPFITGHCWFRTARPPLGGERNNQSFPCVSPSSAHRSLTPSSCHGL